MKAKFIIIAIFAVIFSSCKEKPTGDFWGVTEFYESFLFKKYESVRMEKTLEFEFNDDALRLGFGNIEFEIVEKQLNGDKETVVLARGIQLYKNDNLCVDNILTITPQDSEVKLAIVFTPDAVEGNHTLFLRCKTMGGLDRIDDTELASGIVVKKNDIHNPLALLLFWLAVSIVILLIVYLILIRPLMFETFKRVKIIYFTYPELMKTVKLKGCYKVICSKNKVSQSFFSKLFTGKIAFAQNEFWQQNMEIVPKDKKSVRLRPPKGFNTTSTTLSISTDVEITNPDTKQKLKLKIN